MNFTSHASPEFWALYDRLLQVVQKRACKQFEISARDPLHHSLRLKPVGPILVDRVSRSYRALAARREEHFFWFWIGSHSDYDNFIAGF